MTYKPRNKELQKHIEKGRESGKFDEPSKSNKRQKERHKMDEIKNLYNQTGYIPEEDEI